MGLSDKVKRIVGTMIVAAAPFTYSISDAATKDFSIGPYKFRAKAYNNFSFGFHFGNDKKKAKPSESYTKPEVKTPEPVVQEAVKKVSNEDKRTLNALENWVVNGSSSYSKDRDASKQIRQVGSRSQESQDKIRDAFYALADKYSENDKEKALEILGFGAALFPKDGKMKDLFRSYAVME